MKTDLHPNSAPALPPIITMQAAAVRRRIAASDAVAALVGELAFGPTCRSDLTALHAVTSARVADAIGVR